MADYTQSITPEQAATTLHEWIRRVSDHTTRLFTVFRRMAARRRITYNHAGDKCKWPVKFALPVTRPFRRNQLVFPESRKHVQFELEPVAFYAGDALDLLTQLQNKGDSALVKRSRTIADDLRQSMQQRLYKCMYTDGSSVTDYPSGMETFSGTTGTPTTADKIVQPSATYAGYSTALQTFRGTWDNTMSVQPNHELSYDWPVGEGDSRFDATSPKCVNTYCSLWPSGQTGVSDNLEDCIATCGRWITTLAGDEHRPDICVLADDWFGIYDAIQRSKTVINVPHLMGQDVGFQNPVRGWNQDGMFITTEFGVPASRGYVMNTNTMAVQSWFPQLFSPAGPEHEFRTQADLWAIFFYGQFQFQPRHSGFIKDFVN